jgi:hypothetical protein
MYIFKLAEGKIINKLLENPDDFIQHTQLHIYKLKLITMEEHRK